MHILKNETNKTENMVKTAVQHVSVFDESRKRPNTLTRTLCRSNRSHIDIDSWGERMSPRTPGNALFTNHLVLGRCSFIQNPVTMGLSAPIISPVSKPIQCSSRNGGKSDRSSVEVPTDVGKPLPEEIKNLMERRFGADFSSVRIHSDDKAGQAALSLGAKAFTHGSDVYFAPGQLRTIFVNDGVTFLVIEGFSISTELS